MDQRYRLRPEPGKLPAAVKAMSEFGVFRDMDTAGIYVGFMAGVLHTNAARAEELVSKMFRCRPRTRWPSSEPSPTPTFPAGRT